MSDRSGELEHYKIQNRHFIFTTETPAQVDAIIEAFEKQLPLDGKVRRLSR
jgi:hypothetical protein